MTQTHLEVEGWVGHREGHRDVPEEGRRERWKEVGQTEGERLCVLCVSVTWRPMSHRTPTDVGCRYVRYDISRTAES